MAYEEYDYYNEPSSGSLKESLYQILHGLKDPQKLREAGTSLKSALQLTPNVTESLGRGGVAQAIGTSGDLRDLSNTINSYLPKGVRNFTRAAEFLANPYSTAIQQTAPTTEETLDFVPRVSAPYEGYKQHETLGEYIAPASAYFGVKGLKAVKDLPIGATIQDVSKIPLTPKEAEILASQVDELGFHSPLENAILGIKQPKGTGDQFLKQLERTPGVKTEELDVTGVKQYLLDHPTVTKQELLDYMGTGRLKLEQKVLSKSNVGDVEDYQLRGGEVYHDDDYIRSMADDLHYDMKNDDVIRSQEREALLEADPERYADYDTNPYSQARLEEDIDGVLYENAKQQANDMYYENPISHYYDDLGYDIYGNDDMGYSFKDPSGGFLDIGGRNGTYDLSDAEAALREYHFEQGNLDYGYDVPKYEDYTLPGGYSNYREVLTTLPANMDKYDQYVDILRNKYGQGGFDNLPLTDIERNRLTSLQKENNNFESSHFDEFNILAHTRLNDRIINGKKTLMVEEIQSDWHQAGRRKGYDTPEVRQNIAKERQRLLDQKDYYTKLAEPYAAEGKDSPPDVIEGWTKAANGLQELQKVENNMAKAVPDAPFKKNWHELMMKQILNEAVKGDYDAVAFTTGKQQAERYSLSKQISSIKYTDDGQLRAYGKNGEEVIARKLDSPDQLEDYIGKEAAKKLMEQEPQMVGIKGDMGTVSNTGRELSGVDLDVGGEGMKGFYDKILPDFVNKYTKKYGMGTKKTNLDPNALRHDLTDKELDEGLEKIGMTSKKYYQLPISERSDIYQKISKEFYPREKDQVHFVELTDAAKKDIKEKGQPLFSGIGLAAPPLLMDEEDN
jgi:hypothetical protein